MPPSNSERKYDSKRLLTSLEGVFKRERIVDLETFLRPASDTALVLIEANVEDILLSC
jgi:hypothetical protein